MDVVFLTYWKYRLLFPKFLAEFRLVAASQICLLELNHNLFAVSIIDSIPVRNTQKYSDEIHWELKRYGPYHFTRRNQNDAPCLRFAAKVRPSLL